MSLKSNSGLGSAFKNNFFQKALEGKEDQEKNDIERKINLHRANVSKLESELNRVVERIVAEMNNTNRDLGTNVPDFEINSTLRNVLGNLRN